MNSNILDSSVWISFIIENKNAELIESEDDILISTASLFEIKRKLIKDKVSSADIENTLKFIKKRCLIIPIDEKIADKAADISAQKNIPAMDSLIYATALLNNAALITLDNDFRGFDKVSIL